MRWGAWSRSTPRFHHGPPLAFCVLEVFRAVSRLPFGMAKTTHTESGSWVDPTPVLFEQQPPPAPQPESFPVPIPEPDPKPTKS